MTAFFIQKITQDILFFSSTIEQIYKRLMGNTHLIKRTEHLKSLKRLIKLFNDMLNDIIAKRLPVSQSLKASIERFTDIRNHNEKCVREMTALLKSDLSTGENQEYMVSAEEFRFLLAQDEENG